MKEKKAKKKKVPHDGWHANICDIVFTCITTRLMLNQNFWAEQ